MYIKNNNVNKNVCNKDKYEDKKMEQNSKSIDFIY